MKHYEPSEKLVEILMKKTQNNNPLFFRVLVSYYIAKITSMMRIGIQTHDRGVIPVSLYALNLSVSGSGKGFSTNIVEEQVINLFRERFLEETFPVVSQANLSRLAIKRAIKYDIDDTEMLALVNKEFEDLGQLAFSFDSGTTAAVKQMRHKLLMANAGSVNLEIDEIGNNLLGNTDVLSVFLELFDVGKVKQKLIKNTNENKRSEEIDGRTPTNMMLFGTPNKVLNGGKEEAELMSMFDTGYARRCFFGYTGKHEFAQQLTPEQIYDMMTDSASIAYLKKLSVRFGKLADPVNFNKTLTMSKDVSLLVIEYKLQCDLKASKMRDHEDMLKAELQHRYYKALKLAGGYAFVDGNFEITKDHLEHAIKLAEESGAAFGRIITRERNYVKLAKYIATADRELTQVDLVEDLPFYKGGNTQQKELMALAVAYGYKNNIIIKKTYSDGIEFLTGETLQETDLDKMTFAFSKETSFNYKSKTAGWDKLHNMICKTGYNYTAHQFANGHRVSSCAKPGFNMVIIDIDGGVSMQTAQDLLVGYKALFATTKRHTPELNRFRIILPLSHTVKLNSDMYSKFMENVFNWLPFNTDGQTKDIARKWMSADGQHVYQEGNLLDATLFIPETRKEEEQHKIIMDNESLDNMERWFYLNTNTGNRSNQLIKYALVLVDNGMSIEGIRSAVLAFNSKLKNALPDDEVNNTIMVTVIKAVTARDMK